MKILKEFRWVLIGFVSLVLFYAALLILVPTDNDNQFKESRKSLATPNPNAAAVSQYSILAENNRTESDISEGKRKDFKHKPRAVKKGKSPVAALSDKNAPDPDPGLEMSEEELKALHERQMREIEKEESDMDAIVIPPSKSRPSGMTRRELKALHERQMREIEIEEKDLDAIVIPPSKSRPSGMTRRELKALHERQMREIEIEEKDLDAIVIPPEDGQPGVTRRELQALQKRQMSEIEMMEMDPDEK